MPAYLQEGGAHRRACLAEIPRAELSKDLACFLGASLFAMLWLGPLCLVQVYECRKPAASCIQLPPVLQQLHDGDKGSLQPALLSVEAGCVRGRRSLSVLLHRLLFESFQQCLAAASVGFGPANRAGPRCATGFLD